MGDNKVYHVPGTFSSKEDVEKSFKTGLKERYNNEEVQIIDNGRKLENNDADRQKLADKVVKQIIEDRIANPNEPIRLTGHSHGGNVQKIVTQKLVEQGYDNIVDDMLLLGTPVRDDYKINNNALKTNTKVINAYDSSDFVQKNGNLDGTKSEVIINILKGKGNGGKQIIQNNRKVKNIQVESPSFDPLFGDHLTIDSKEVLEQLKND